ncbi:MAG TPA: signal recognition particle-docking protein FtsY [Pseudolabrys sp.]
MSDSDTNDGEQNGGWLKRLSGGLKRTSTALGDAIADLSKTWLDANTLDDLELELLRADLGLETAAQVRLALSEGKYKTDMNADEVKAVLAAELEKALVPVAKPLEITARPFVILVCGVNGSGKTTTIGKLAAKFRAEGKSVMLVAGDTFRAAAIDQLKIWATRTGASIKASSPGADAASLAFDAITAARAESVDVVLVDTAGRLQNRAELMGELEKMLRVIRKVEPTAPQAVLLVLDATVGQNALNQVEIFGKMAGVTGLVMTKLDGTARGGILVAIAAKFGLPVHFIGVGEGIDDLAAFTARDFSRAVAGLEG